MRRDELIGRTIAKRFRVKRLLGEGGMATVFEAEQDGEPREIALKILRPELCADRTFARRFEREARAAARVQHPSSVTILDAGVDGDLSYIAMELLHGDDLFALLERHGVLSPRAAATIVAEVCDALAVAHGLGIVHRDLKPENIMIVRGPPEGPDGPESVPLPPGARVKVLDFGIAKLLDKGGDAARPQAGRLESATGMTAMTRVGTLIGTPAYMSPEQCALSPVDTRSDIYTCGLLLFQMVTGRLPFDGPTPLHIATKHIHEEPPPLRSLVPDADAALEALVRKALAKRPADRWLTARALGNALRKLLPTLPDRPYSVLEPEPEPEPVADSASTPVLVGDSIRSLRGAGGSASIEEPPSDRMASAKTVVADGVSAPPPSVVVREPDLARRPLAILARHAPQPAPDAEASVLPRHDSEVTEPGPATPTVQLVPEATEPPAEVEAEPEDLASTLVRAAPGEPPPDGGSTAPGGARQITMQSAAPLPGISVLGAAPPPAPSPPRQPGAGPYAGPPALVPVPAKMPIPMMPAASVILAPSVAVPSLPGAPPPAPLGPVGPASHVAPDNAHAVHAPTFGMPGPPAQAGLVDSGTRAAAIVESPVSRALWLGVLIGVLGSAILFALAYVVFFAK